MISHALVIGNVSKTKYVVCHNLKCMISAHVCVTMCAWSVVVHVLRQGDFGPPGLPAGLGDDWIERVIELKVLTPTRHSCFLYQK